MIDRDSMVDFQIRARGVTHEATLEAMRRVPRDRFVPEYSTGEAYDDNPLPIGHEQTISQPYIVGYMTAALQPRSTDRILEIGTGSGYQTAILGEIVKEVFSIERIPELAVEAARRLAEMGYENVHVRQGDGYHGWIDEAPFDGILVAAATETIPPPLLAQLKVGGRLILPLGSAGRAQELVLVEKRTPEDATVRSLMGVSFVPFLR